MLFIHLLSPLKVYRIGINLFIIVQVITNKAISNLETIPPSPPTHEHYGAAHCLSKQRILPFLTIHFLPWYPLFMPKVNEQNTLWFSFIKLIKILISYPYQVNGNMSNLCLHLFMIWLNEGFHISSWTIR